MKLKKWIIARLPLFVFLAIWLFLLIRTDDVMEVRREIFDLYVEFATLDPDVQNDSLEYYVLRFSILEKEPGEIKRLLQKSNFDLVNSSEDRAVVYKAMHSVSSRWRKEEYKYRVLMFVNLLIGVILLVLIDYLKKRYSPQKGRN